MTPAQRKTFFSLFARACDLHGIAPAEREAYRRSLIAEAVPASGGSLTRIVAQTACDAVLRAVSIAAQSAEGVSRYATAEGNRLAAICETQIRQIWEIELGMPEALRPKGTSRAVSAAAYIRQIIRQAGWSWALTGSASQGWHLDLTLPHLHKLLQMLDTHRRRLIKRAPIRREWGLTPGEIRTMRLAFNIRSLYRWTGEGVLWREIIGRGEIPAPLIAVRLTT